VFFGEKWYVCVFQGVNSMCTCFSVKMACVPVLRHKRCVCTFFEKNNMCVCFKVKIVCVCV
jgi:hypothetical protein